MCGRYVSPDTASIEAAWRVGRGNGNPFARRFNVLPTSDIPILRVHRRDGVIELAQARWGFVPVWWKQPKLPSHAFNARSEEAAGKPMWKDAWRHSRCILPAEGWYEWRGAERPDPETGEIKAYRQPHFIHRADRRLVGIGGLVSYRATPDGKGHLSCAIVTRDAAASVSDVHDRMPVIVPDAMVSKWLDPGVSDLTEVRAMVESADVDFVHHPVSTRLNSAKTDEEAFMNPL